MSVSFKNAHKQNKIKSNQKTHSTESYAARTSICNLNALTHSYCRSSKLKHIFAHGSKVFNFKYLPSSSTVPSSLKIMYKYIIHIVQLQGVKRRVAGSILGSRHVIFCGAKKVFCIFRLHFWNCVKQFRVVTTFRVVEILSYFTPW